MKEIGRKWDLGWNMVYCEVYESGLLFFWYMLINFGRYIFFYVK